jgi:hypothetical protein
MRRLSYACSTSNGVQTQTEPLRVPTATVTLPIALTPLPGNEFFWWQPFRFQNDENGQGGEGEHDRTKESELNRKGKSVWDPENINAYYLQISNATSRPVLSASAHRAG